MDLRDARNLTRDYSECVKQIGGLHGAYDQCVETLEAIREMLGMIPTEPQRASTMDAEVVYVHEPDPATIEKAHHQLHFIQGVFFAKGIWTKEEIEEHNRSGRVGKA